jgi:DNA-binding NarL/FixJ family response regulator/signal transduction histidine kinase
MQLALLAVGTGLGLARFALPAALLGIRWLARLTRQLAGDWCGVPVAGRYAPPPEGRLTFTGRLRWLATDPATWRDLRWTVANPFACVLAMASATIIGIGLIGFIGPEFTRLIPPPAFPGNTRGTVAVLGVAITTAGVVAAPLLLRGYGLLTRTLLAPAGHAELALRVRQLTETRTEALDTGAAEIRRIERDLHDGAQARLVAMGMTLDAAGQIIDTNPEAARALLYEARDASVRALAELRDLVRGVHPPVLADRGLADAIRALALDSPMRVELASDLRDRPPAPVESAAYFAVSELLANVSKHAGARRAWVDFRHGDGTLRIGVTDDGHGGAELALKGAGPGNRGREPPGRGQRGWGPARHRAAAGRLRRSPRVQQPARGADRGHHGGPVRVVIAEDLFLLRDGLTRMLQAHGLQIAAAVDNGADLLAAVTADQPDVAIVDVRLPPTFTDEGIRAALAARREVPGLPVLVLSQYVEQLYARELLASGRGGIGYLLKDRVFDSGQFVDAVRRVAAGGTAMDPEVIARLLARNTGDGTLAALSPREREVLALMAEGRSNAAIAQRLVITERAVAKHTASIFVKLDLQPSDDDNRRVLAVLAYLGG